MSKNYTVVGLGGNAPGLAGSNKVAFAPPKVGVDRLASELYGQLVERFGVSMPTLGEAYRLATGSYVYADAFIKAMGDRNAQ